MSDKIFIVETISVFRHTYYIRAKEATHAQDEVVCRLHDSDFIEGSQHHVGENISDCREVTEREFLKTFDRENHYLKEWSRERKMDHINVIDYGRETKDELV